ncbi:hypothetical protein EVAR_81082_1 [Eumeta japonica]|uniref:Uncharacterized protein n=1 Tax=Eumeta variegata TaxID=151549 RepID=A0A4C1T937_EUMVA|nr:hypothetical protein EVAR_81082_1 [Eumeta japonica]
MNPYNGWSKALKYQEKKTIHWIVQIIGSALAVAGSVVRIMDIEDGFETPHAIFGNSLPKYMPQRKQTAQTKTAKKGRECKGDVCLYRLRDKDCGYVRPCSCAQ